MESVSRRAFLATSALAAWPALAATPWADLEAASGGLLGVAVLDTGTGELKGHRLDERFPMCSTFKWLLAAAVLHRVTQGRESLDRSVSYTREDLAGHAPVTEARLAQGAMSVQALCEAAVVESDNGAANVLLRVLGGPAAVTSHARSLGDRTTRLDRIEPAMNDVPPGDPRDTTTPRAMARLLHRALLQEGTDKTDRALLLQWMEKSTTGRARLRAQLPPGWRAATKTGTGPRGTTNDVGVLWPASGAAPLVVACYLTGSPKDGSAREAVLASVGAAIARG
ncbi:class A beta-lactamase [Ramlibacter algicola]|uniref:Beta-lactamase n=1 Tax=Ramlibacter algicola TaxID=2795217 RepID=A0A934Q3B3_9BURK|nr:class A beta-lactamase [Ramlibacter algicola]MBK0394083.1 class A beta-lactamase [Ramlibacter algicola]